MLLPGKDTSESMLKTIQALALVIGGCWIAFRYIDLTNAKPNGWRALSKRKIINNLSGWRQHSSTASKPRSGN